MSELAIWSAERSEWTSHPCDEIFWLDRVLLSDGRDRSLHRPPRCPGLRYVRHRWELFSRDPTHEVYVAPFTAGELPDHKAVERMAVHSLPAALAAHETQPMRLEAGAWVISLGTWVLAFCVEVTPAAGRSPTVPVDIGLAATYETELPAAQTAGISPEPDAVDRVAKYFLQNPTARLAMAFYYQDFIQGGLAPHALPIAEVAIALDLASEAAVSEYKKELQRRIWQEQGHQRELGEFLLAHSLITGADLRKACALASINQATGRTEQARDLLPYVQRRRSRGS